MEIKGYGTINDNTLIFSNQLTNETFGHEMNFMTKSKDKK